MIKKTLDEKYSYQIDEHNVVHLFRGEEDCQQLLTNPLLSAMFKIETLEKENAELKTKKIPQLERKIASIRGCHSVDIKKLNARIEQVERLKKENAELKKQQFSLRNERNTFLAQNEQYEKDLIDFNENLTKAIKVIKDIVEVMVIAPIQYSERQKIDVLEEAEQFLKNDGCPDVMCEDCTKEDCGIKKLGLVKVKK